jgi:hypothetical protein
MQYMNYLKEELISSFISLFQVLNKLKKSSLKYRASTIVYLELRSRAKIWEWLYSTNYLEPKVISQTLMSYVSTIKTNLMLSNRQSTMDSAYVKRNLFVSTHPLLSMISS